MSLFALAGRHAGVFRFIFSRLSQGLLVMIGVTTLVFIVTRLIGDPVQVMLPVDASAADRQILAQALGFDKPMWQQYLAYLYDVLHFDFGNSLWQHRPARDIVFERLPATLLLCVSAVFMATLLGVPLGVIAALRPGRWADRICVTLSLAGLSLPQFWLGLLLILFFSVTLNWFPSSGADTWDAAVLPIMALTFPSLGRIAMMVRSLMIDELNAPYVRTALAKGLNFPRIVIRHALRNAAVPIVALSGWEFAAMLAGFTVVIETVFAWPGIGQMAMQAIERQDLMLLQAVVFFIAFFIVMINFLLDLVYRLLDRRILV